MKRKKLGEILVEARLVDELQINSALGHQKTWGGRLGEVLVQQGFATEDAIAECLAAQLELPRMDLFESGVDEALARLLPVEMAENYEVLPVRQEGQEGERGSFVWVATADPTNIVALDEVQFRTGRKIRPVVVTGAQIRAAIRYVFYDEPLRSQPPPPAKQPTERVYRAAEPAPVHRLIEAEDSDDDDIPIIELGVEDVVGSPPDMEESSASGVQKPSSTGSVVAVVVAGEPVVAEALPAGEAPIHPEPREQRSLLAVLEAVAAGGTVPAELAEPTRVMSILLTLLIRNGVIDETELISELQRK